MYNIPNLFTKINNNQNNREVSDKIKHNIVNNNHIIVQRITFKWYVNKAKVYQYYKGIY